MLIARQAASPAPRRRAGVPDFLAAPALFLAAALVARAPGFLTAVADPDEGLYMAQAVAWLGGGWPYVAVWDMHPPGAPALLALVHALVAEPVIALRLTGVLAVAATATGLWSIARLLGAGPRTALAAGLLYAAHSVVPGGLATNTEILFAPFVVLAARLLLGEAVSPAPPRAGRVLAAGLAAGMALWIKQVTALESAALWLTMAAVAVAAGRIGAARLATLALLFAAGAGGPSLLVAAGYALAGAWEAWLQANLLAPLAYAGVAQEAPGLRRGLVASLPPLSALLVLAAGLGFPDPVARRAGAWLLPWLLAAAAAVALPGKFYDHYFLILLPPLCLVGAFGLAAIARHALNPATARRGFAALLALALAVPAAGMLLPRLGEGIGLRGRDPVREVARLAADALPPGEALFVANWHAMTYVLAGRAPPTRYAFPLHLSGRAQQLAGGDMQGELARVLALPPGVIVLAPGRWRDIRPEARAAIEAAVARDYRLVATVPDPAGEVQVWRLR